MSDAEEPRPPTPPKNVNTWYGYPGYQPPPHRPYNGFAIASLVLGITWVWWIGSLLAVIFGWIARRQIDESNGWERGRGMATAGLVLGLVWLALLALAIVASVATMDDRSSL